MRAHRIHPILTGLVQTALKACEGVRFHPDIMCNSCGSPLSGYDERKKRFAVLLEDDKPRPVYVIIQRSYCRKCRKVISPQEPFYEGTRVGSPVVDLCRSLSIKMPYSRVSTYVGLMGVQIDRWSVRHYACTQLQEMPAEEVFRMRIPVSILALSLIGGSVQEPGHPDMDDILAACHYPSHPFDALIQPFDDAGTIINKENLQKIISRITTEFPRSLGIIICSIILMNMFSTSYFPTGLIDSFEMDMDIMSINVF